MQTMKALAKNFLNLIYPLHCLGCETPLEAMNELRLCRRCIASINRNAMPPFELDDLQVLVYSACLYDGGLKELVHRFKYKGKTVLAKIFSKLMLDYIKENPEITDVDLITVVPLHKERLREREFNQSLLIASPISKAYSLALTNALEKTRKTRYQNELLKSERLKNLEGAFGVSPEARIGDKRILLIDDIMTTGSTLGECAKTFLDGGAKSVICFTLARGI
ncbi:MAG: ComF family protein [Candidatus Omnitrophica bacterium]|nr:ComF family protein [Candidatus Omnitrophota bacterium]